MTNENFSKYQENVRILSESKMNFLKSLANPIFRKEEKLVILNIRNCKVHVYMGRRNKTAYKKLLNQSSTKMLKNSI